MSPDRDASSVGQYFDEDPTAASEPIVVDVTLPDAAFTMETDRGVFSRGRLDTATSMLLRSDRTLPPSGDLLDLGCGAGPIAMTMARRAPDATVWAIDVNRRALDLTARNAERSGIGNIRVAHPDDVPSGVAFSAMWSNPPIRIGKGPLHALLQTWLSRLTPNGTALLVVQKHLGADSLQRWLTTQGYRCSRVGSKAGYRLLEVDSVD